MTRLKRTRRSRGFTLIETAIALAVTGFALVSIMGMLPVGLTNFRLARQATFYSEMVQTLQAQAETTSFVSLQPGQNLPQMYFDGEGNQLSSSNGAVYMAEAVVNKNDNPNYGTGLNSQMQGPGGSTTPPSTILYLSLQLYFLPTGTSKPLQQYPYFVGDSGN